MSRQDMTTNKNKGKADAPNGKGTAKPRLKTRKTPAAAEWKPPGGWKPPANRLPPRKSPRIQKKEAEDAALAERVRAGTLT